MHCHFERGHLLLLAAWLTTGALLSKPRMSYYSVDVMSSLPAGGPAAGGGCTRSRGFPRLLLLLHLQRSPSANYRPKRSSGWPGSLRKPQLLPEVAASKEARIEFERPHWLAMDNQGLGKSAGTGSAEGRGGPAGGGGSGLMADAGPAFPYPVVFESDRGQAEPSMEATTRISAGHVVASGFRNSQGRTGEQTSRWKRSSSDSMFDQLAQRAVMYSNPLVPLPAGYPDDTLRVHMKFVGKPL